MKKLVLLIAPLLTILTLGPLLIALITAGIVTPAALSTMGCEEEPPVAAAGEWRPPFQQRYTRTSPFGRRFHPIYKEWRPHTGQDLATAPGAGPVVAAAAGTVLSVRTRGAYGNMVTLRHPGSITTRYGHLASIDRKIRPGAVVAIGQRLGVEGSTGASTGLHLHFQVEINGKPVNPVPFMANRGAPLNGTAIPASSKTPSLDTVHLRRGAPQRGVVFALPPPGEPRQNSLHNPPLPIPHKIKRLYLAAAAEYKILWTLLAGIGMEETGHGRNNHTSSAGAKGLMQFMPGTWASMGVDGDGDGRADIHNDADSIYSAANYLTKSGVRTGAAGVRRALFAYNPIDWYVNDVLYYAAHYGRGGTLPDDPNNCRSPVGDPKLASDTTQHVAEVLAWAKSHDGDTYQMGAAGPHTWDCSSFTQAAYAHIGIHMPRTATAQRNWLAAGNGTRIKPGHEKPGDLIFWDSYLGPTKIGHVMIIWKPATKTTIEARNTRAGVGHFSYANGPSHHIFEIWRVRKVAGPT